MNFVMYVVYDSGRAVFQTTDRQAAYDAANAMNNGKVEERAFNSIRWTPAWEVRRSSATGKYVATAIPHNRGVQLGEHMEYGYKMFCLLAPTAREAEAEAERLDSGRYYTIRLQVVEIDSDGKIVQGPREGDWDQSRKLDFKWKALDTAKRKLDKLARILQRSFAYPTPDGPPPYTKEE